VKKLSRIFQTKKGALREAIREDDIALMEKLMGKKDVWLIFELFKPEAINGMTPRMAEAIVSHVHTGNSIDWGLDRGRKGAMAIVTLFATQARIEKKYELLDVFFDGRLDFCAEKLSAAAITDLIGSDVDNDKKVEYLKKLLSVESKLPEPDTAVRAAVDKSALGALDVLAASGINLRENNEFWLREAAKNDKRHVCVHLVEKHGADLARALKTAQDLGTHNIYLYLDNLRQDIQPQVSGEETPATVESLSREVKELRAALREVTALVTEMQAERKIDKIVDKPGLQAKAYNT
jgi:hypothetical protein